MDALHGHTTLRTREVPKKAPSPTSERRCACGTVLSKYNNSEKCGACEAREHEEQLARDIEKNKAWLARCDRVGRPRTKGVIKIGDVKLTPVDGLPGRQRVGRWEETIKEFISSGVDCVRIDGVKAKPNSLAAAVKTTLTRMGEKRCYSTCRQGHVYLVRIK